MNAFLAVTAALAYGLAGFRSSRDGSSRTHLIWAPAALALHAGAILFSVVEGGALGVGVTEAFSLFAWQAALTLWVLCLMHPLNALGALLYPLAAVAALSGALIPSSVSAIPLADWKILLHVALSLFSAGFLTLAAAQAVTLAIQDRLLHRHASGGLVQRLPPLQTMEKVLFQLILLGFFLLSLSLVTGLLFVDNLLAQHLAHKTVLSVTAWLTFGVLLWGRWQRGWRGRTAIRWALSGYGVLVLAYFGSKLVLEQILGRHWS